MLVVEDNGARLTAPAGGDPGVVERALQAYLARPNAAGRVSVEQWNGAAVLGSGGESLLRALGFTRTPSGMERWAPR